MYGWYYWLIGFGLTLVFEAPIVLWLLRKAEPKLWRRLATFVFANLITHPLVWLFFPMVPLPNRWPLILSETWAFGAEALFYAYAIPNLGMKRATLTSVLANGFSWAVGGMFVRHFQDVLFR